MTKYPGAEWLPLGKDQAHQSLLTTHDIVCLHTMVGSLAGTDAYFKTDGYVGTESHFGVGENETEGIHQYTDLDRRADANLDGNWHVVSIETADKGGSFPDWTGSNVPAWNDWQVEAISQMVAWLCKRYDIPAKLIPDTLPTRRGIAYHRQGIKGNWTDNSGWKRGEVWSSGEGKPCPGDRRMKQVSTVIIPRVIEILNGDDMSAEDVKEIKDSQKEQADRIIEVIRAGDKADRERDQRVAARLTEAVQAIPAGPEGSLDVSAVETAIRNVFASLSTDEAP